MNILQIHNKYQFAGGEDVAVLTERRMLVSKGHNVFSVEANNSDLKKIFSERSRIYKNVQSIIDNNKIDVAHIHNVYHIIGNDIYEVISKNTIPIVQTLHNFRFLCPAGLFLDNQTNQCELCKKGDFYNSFFKKCYRDSYIQSLFMMQRSGQGRKYAIENVDRFIALNSFYKEKYIEGGFCEDKISIKPYVMYEDNKSLVQLKGEYALYLGRISKEKGVETLLEVFADLGKPLVIAGTGENVYFNTLIERFKQFKNIQFKGFINGVDKIKVISNAQFIVVPSVWFENSPLTIYESYSLKKPVIGSNIGGLPSIIKDNETGYLFEPGNTESLKEAVIKILDNDKFIEMGLNGYNYFSENFTEKQNYEQLMTIYQSAIEERAIKTNEKKGIT